MSGTCSWDTSKESRNPGIQGGRPRSAKKRGLPRRCGGRNGFVLSWPPSEERPHRPAAHCGNAASAVPQRYQRPKVAQLGPERQKSNGNRQSCRRTDAPTDLRRAAHAGIRMSPEGRTVVGAGGRTRRRLFEWLRLGEDEIRSIPAHVVEPAPVVLLHSATWQRPPQPFYPTTPTESGLFRRRSLLASLLCGLASWREISFPFRQPAETNGSGVACGGHSPSTSAGLGGPSYGAAPRGLPSCGATESSAGSVTVGAWIMP